LSTDGVGTATSTRAWTPDAFSVTLQWVAKGAWAILDQGLFAISNFGINIMMARWLAPRDYGAFTLAYAVFLVLATVHSALVVEPMLVFGAGKHRERFSTYLTVLMKGHWWLTAAAGLVLGAVGSGALLLSTEVGVALLALAASTPFILLLWLVRRVCYLENRAHLAASGGLAYMAVLMGGAYALFKLQWLSSPTAFVLMGVASVTSALWIKSRLPPASRGESKAFRREIAAQHWRYGRWAVGTGVLGALVLNLYYFVIPIWHGLEATATLKALMNLMMPALHAFLALWVIALPRFVRVRETPAFGVLIRRLLFLCCGAAILNWVALGLSHNYIVRFLYRGAYASDSQLLWIVGLVPLCYAVTTILENALRSLERSDEVFRAYVFSVGVTCLVGLPLTYRWGVGGAVAGLVIASTCSLSSLTWSLKTRRAIGTTRRQWSPAE
jgi:O-antigen/teichoic acid export membrane protein